MARNVVVRFTEHQRYDPMQDAEVVRFMATTSSGSYWSDVFLEGPKGLRHDRELFKTTVVDLIQNGSAPQFVDLSGDMNG